MAYWDDPAETDECPCSEARSRDCHIHPTDPDDPED